jgi:hypothetical protein
VTTQDPKIVRSSVRIKYRADDGYASEHEADSRLGTEPHVPLLAALEELARLTALFGFEVEALECFNAARKRVSDWKAAR